MPFVSAKPPVSFRSALLELTQTNQTGTRSVQEWLWKCFVPTWFDMLSHPFPNGTSGGLFLVPQSHPACVGDLLRAGELQSTCANDGVHHRFLVPTNQRSTTTIRFRGWSERTTRNALSSSPWWLGATASSLTFCQAACGSFSTPAIAAASAPPQLWLSSGSIPERGRSL